MCAKMNLREKQKVVLSQKGKKVIIEDWKK